MSQLLDVLLGDTQRLIERRTKPTPPVPVSRADKIIAEGDRRRLAYRCLHPDADTTMVFGVQVGYLHGEIRRLCNEAEALNIKRDSELQYVTVTCGDIAGEVIVGFTYEAGEDSQTSGPPENCYEGSPEELEVCEAWVNGVELSAALSESVLDTINAATLERVHQAQAKAREWDGE